MSKTTKLISGAIIGAIAGSVTVLLLTPESGDDTRLAISEKLLYIRRKMKEAAKEKRLELEAEIEQYKNA
jgi:gas vesicle protein